MKMLKRDWIGRKVRTLRDLKNHYEKVPAGTVLTVTDSYGGLTLESEPCALCGVWVYITKVQEHDVILLPVEDKNI